MGTVPVPYSPVAGDDATQARVLTWADGIAYLLGSATAGGSKRPVCVMRQTVAQSIANNTSTAVTFDVEDVDYDNGHSTVTNTSRYTAATAGWHHVDYIASFASNAANGRSCYLRINGTTDVTGSWVSDQTPASAVAAGVAGSRLVFLNAGDYLELMVNQGSGGALNTSVVAGNAQSSMCVEWRSN